MIQRFAWMLSIMALAALAGCRSSSYAERGAVTGGLVGGVTGAALDGSAGGALLGGAVGSMVGAVVGDDLDAEVAEREMLAAERARQELGPRPVTPDEIVTMVKSGVGEDVVVNHIQTHGMAYPLSAQDIVRLHEQGVGDPVIKAMQDAVLRAEPAPPAMIIREPVPVPVYREVYPPHHPHFHPRRHVRWGVSVYR